MKESMMGDTLNVESATVAEVAEAIRRGDEGITAGDVGAVRNRRLFERFRAEGEQRRAEERARADAEAAREAALAQLRTEVGAVPRDRLGQLLGEVEDAIEAFFAECAAHNERIVGWTEVLSRIGLPVFNDGVRFEGRVIQRVRPESWVLRAAEAARHGNRVDSGLLHNQ